MKKYIKNLVISASIIAIANINKASEKKTGAITIVFDGKEYKDDGTAKIKFLEDQGKKEDYIINDLEVYFTGFTNNGKAIDGDTRRYLITNIEGKGVKYDPKKMTYTFTEGEQLKIHLKSKNHIKIKYTGVEQFKCDIENDLIKVITNDTTVEVIFSFFFMCFKGDDCGTSNINGEDKNSAKSFKDIDKGEVTITIDSSKIDDTYIRRCFVKPVGSVDFIKPDMLNKLNCYIDFPHLNLTLGNLKTQLNNSKIDKDCNNDPKNGKPIITGQFKIKINGKGNEIPSTEDATNLTGAKFIHLIVDKHSFNPYFLKKELKFDIVGGKDNYIISDEVKNKIQKSLNTLINAEEVTEDAIIVELKKLEKDVFVKDGIVGKNIKCYKTGENIAIKSNFGTDITVKIDPKAINPNNIKIKLTLGNIKNNENINLDSAVVTAINEKIKAVKFGISVKDILAILNNNELKNYFTGDLVDTDILDNNGNVLTNNVLKHSTIKIKADKIKSEHFKKVQEEDKDKENDETGQNSTQNVVKKETYCGRYCKKKPIP